MSESAVTHPRCRVRVWHRPRRRFASAGFPLGEAAVRLEKSRRDGDHQTIKFYRATLALSAAWIRAKRGDHTAARRLAWHQSVVGAHRELVRLRWRFRSLESEIARLIRGSDRACVHCEKHLARTRERRDEVVAEILRLPRRLTYAEFVRSGGGAADAIAAREPTITPDDTLREAGISDERQDAYQRRMSSLLAGGRDLGRGVC